MMWKVQSVSRAPEGGIAVVYRWLRLHPTKGWRPERSKRRVFEGPLAERAAFAFVAELAPKQVR